MAGWQEKSLLAFVFTGENACHFVANAGFNPPSRPSDDFDIF
jgi:hypothetical protein